MKTMNCPWCEVPPKYYKAPTYNRMINPLWRLGCTNNSACEPKHVSYYENRGGEHIVEAWNVMILKDQIKRSLIGKDLVELANKLYKERIYQMEGRLHGEEFSKQNFEMFFRPRDFSKMHPDELYKDCFGVLMRSKLKELENES